MSIRARFAILTAGLMICLLLVLSIGIHWWMERSLRSELDQGLSRVYTTYRNKPDLIPVGPGLALIQAPDPDPFTSAGIYIQAFQRDESGEFQLVAKSTNLDAHSLPLPLDVVEQNVDHQDAYFEDEIDGTRMRIYSAPVFLQGDRLFAIVQVAESLEPLHETLRKLQTILVAGSAVSIILVTGAVWFIAGTAVQPLKRMTRTAETIGGAQDLSQRIDIPRNDDEIRRLAITFNAMLDRLELTFDAQQQFVADASHELRTPLTALRGNADILLKMAEMGEIDQVEFVGGLSDISSESGRLSRLVQDLLTLARADVGWQPEMDSVNLTEITAEVARNMATIAEHHQFVVQIPDVRTSALYVHGSADQITQLILILLDNAFTHTPPETRVTLSLKQDRADAVITVSDDGPGLSEEHIDRIFDRFYRADVSRNRASGGTGLGLSIARWITDIHDGSLEATSDDNAGATFTVRIPMEEHPESEHSELLAKVKKMPVVHPTPGHG